MKMELKVKVECKKSGHETYKTIENIKRFGCKICGELIGFEKDAEHGEAISGEVRDIVLDTNLAQKELNWEVKTDLKQGLKETIEWFKTNKNL